MRNSEKILREAIDRIISKHGTLRAAGDAIGVDHSYLHKLGSGSHCNPSASVLKKLGLRKRVVFEWVSL